MTIFIRFATLDDAEAILKIYKPYVRETAITFEYDLPSLPEFKERMATIMAFYPYLVAEEDGQILGYAYATAFHPRAAYAWSAEAAIYLDKSVRGQGLGRRLYDQLESYLKAMGILNVNACIATTEQEDDYLTDGSQSFHEKLGFSLVGKFHKVGYKFHRWYDMIWMEKMLGEHTEDVSSVKSIYEIRQK